jgi:NAD(P)-dependent dehydrogenase (short-subunit alcohol dehydrogenase family)
VQPQSSADPAELTYLVAGGTGVAGECVVRALLEARHTVIVPSRSPSKLDDLQNRLPPEHSQNLHTIVCNVGEPSGSTGLQADIIERFGSINGVIASLGGWWEGPQLVDVEPSTWDSILRGNLTAHFFTASAILPVLAETTGAVYVMLAGIAAELPVPFSGPISVTGAAQRMLIRTLANEPISDRVRLHELAIMTPIVTARWTGDPPEPGWLTGEQVGQRILEIVSPDFAEADQLLLTIP